MPAAPWPRTRAEFLSGRESAIAMGAVGEVQSAGPAARWNWIRLNPEAHYLLGMALRRTGPEDEARREFERTKQLREKALDKRR